MSTSTKKQTAKLTIKDYLDNIEVSLPEMVKIPLQPAIRNEGYENPTWRNYGIYRKGGGNCVGVMSESFPVQQPLEIFAAILTAAKANKSFNLKTLQYFERFGGQVMGFKIMVDKVKVPTKIKKGDVTEFWLEFSTSYSGRQGNKFQLWTRRCVCDNGMTALGLDHSITIANRPNRAGEVLVMFQDLAEILTDVKNYEDKLIRLSQRKLTKKQIAEVVNKVFKFKQENPSAATLKKLEAINEAIDLEVGRTGQTAFGVLQGITYYTNHDREGQKGYDREKSVMYGTGKKINDRAQKILLEYV